MANENLILDINVNTGNTTAELNKVTENVKGVEGALKDSATQAVTLKDSLQFGRAVIGGIAAVKGAMIGLGMENNNVIKSLTQIMALQQTYTGVMQVVNTLSSQNVIITKAKTAATWLFNTAAQATATTMAAVTGGITILIAAIGGLLVWLKNTKTAQTELATATKEANKELANQRKEIEKTLNAARRGDEIKQIEARISALKAAKATTAEIERAEMQLRDLRKVHASEDIAELTKVRDFRLSAVKQLDEVITATERQINEATNTGLRSSLKIQLADLQAAKNEELIILHETNAKINELEIVKTEQTIAGFKKVEEAKGLTEAQIEAEQKRLNQLRIDEQNELNRLLVEQITDREQKELAMLQLKHANERTAIINKYGADTALIIELEKVQKNEILQLEQKFIDDKQALKDKEAAQNKANAAKELAETKALNDAKLQAQRVLSDGIMDLTAAMGDDSERAVRMHKQMALLQVAIDTATAISQATAKGVTGEPVSTAVKIATTIGVIMGNIAKARAILNSVPIGGTLTMPGEGQMPRGGVGSYGAGGITTPPPANGNNDGGAQSMSTGTGGNLRVYVTEADITNTQNNMAFLNKVATI